MCPQVSFEQKSTGLPWFPLTAGNDDSCHGPQRCVLDGKPAGAKSVQQIETVADQVCGMPPTGHFSFRTHRVGREPLVFEGGVSNLYGHVSRPL